MRLFGDSIKSIFRLTIVKTAIFTLFLLLVCRIGWHISNHFWYGSHSKIDLLYSFLIGVYFDLPVVGWFFLPFWIWLTVFPRLAERKPKISRLIYTLSAALVILLTAIDCGYSRVTGRRSGTELFATLTDEGNHIAPYIMEYWWGIVILIGFILFVFWAVPVRGNKLLLFPKERHIVKSVVIALLVAFIWLTVARGGWRTKPLASLDASEFVNPSLMQLTSNTPLQMISTGGQEAMIRYHFYSKLEAEEMVLGKWKHTGNPNKMNIVLIIVESLGSDYTGFINGTPFTPFLDSLSKKSLNFRHCYANGVRSIEMVPAIFCGIPGVSDGPFVHSSFAGNSITNAMGCASKLGYSTGFFHGGKNGTMRFQSFLAQTGSLNYYGLNEYPSDLKEKDYDGSWGIFDEPYLQYFKGCLDTMKAPFFASVFTLSSHHPYAIPKKYADKLPTGELPIHTAVAYTDKALESFFEAASKTKWFSNTIFVITADHTSYSKNPYFYSESGHYEIPLLIYKSNIVPEIIEKTVSQLDIIPTVTDYMGLNLELFGLGRSAFDSYYGGYSIHRDNGINYILQYPYTLGMNDKGVVTSFYKRAFLSTEIEEVEQAGPQYNSMLKYLKSSLQVYSERQAANKWHW